LALLAPGLATPLLAQSANPDDARVPAEARVLFESLAVVPTIRLTNVGWDDNVLYANEGERKTGDFTATVSPGAEVWLRLPGVRVRGRSAVDFIYFREVTHYRSIDTDNSGRVELLLGRVTPYIGGHWAKTRHRQNLEIDLPVRRVDVGWDAGMDVRLTGKTSVGVTTRRFSVDYTGDTVYLNTDLARYLAGETAAEGVWLGYAATPLTTVGMSVQRHRNRFTFTPERDSDSVRISSVVEFHPLAPVSGRAEIGVIRRTFVDGEAAPFRGTVARIDLGYTLLGRTRFAIGLRRDLSYSYRADQRDYLQTGVELSVTHRLANAWDVRGTFGRFSLAYGLAESPGTPAGATPEERVRSYGVDVGRYIAGTRVGLQMTRQARRSDFTGGRDYTRTRIVSSVTYGF
jgi:hypothetical protein